jgi:HAD superfamily hydrolase (TIGR01509 family)
MAGNAGEKERAKSPLRNIRAVIFDMDGLMFDTERLARACWKEAAARRGLDLPASLMAAAMGLTCSDVKKLFQKHFDENGVAADASALHHASNELLLEKVEAEGAPVKPGLYALLERLREKGLRAAVASSSYEGRVETLLRKSGLSDAFDAIVHGGDVAKGKPAPDIFLVAASRLGRDPGECLALEDSENGVRAAAAAGMPVIMIPDLKEPSEEARELALRVAPSLNDIIPLI